MTASDNRMPVTPAQRWVLALASVGSFIVVLDLLVVSTALTAIRADLGASIEQLEWTINAYTVAFAVLLMTAAGLGDRFGRRKSYAVGLGLFALASAACALAPDVGWLIAARTVQGMGAAAIMPLALALLNVAFAPQQRGWAVGVFGGVTGLGALLGPVVGGLVTQGLRWEWIFWLNVPIVAAAIPLVLTRTEESVGPRTPLDVRGVLLVTGAVFGLVWALMRGNSAGWRSPEALASWVIGAALGVAFVAWERRAPAPMLPMRLFRSPAFAAGNAGIFLVNAAITGAIFLMAQFLQTALGQGPLDSGLQLLPWGVAPFLLTPIAGAMINRIGARTLAACGTALMAIGLGWVALIAAPSLGYGALVAPLVLIGTGMALAVPALTRSAVSSVEPPDIAAASGTFSTLRQLGGAFGVAAVAAVFAATGNYTSPQAFTAGFAPAMGVTAVLVLVGIGTALGLPRRSTSDRRQVAVGAAE
ncbi:DHA2 family efflux MFS transporter permease subunit [Pseudonocardia sp. GCM10023141]|uniref:DHA2 family efflux MFS transporter permease subunit n=1 Tax=Pseudonocardia sp. GCM10023141 TaxID=3252653 RepID=UPI0036074754